MNKRGACIDSGYDRDVDAQCLVPVLAARDGIISFAAKSKAGYTITLAHADGWSTHYGGLAQLRGVCTDRFGHRRKQRMRAGEVIGYCRRAPVRICFELWRAADRGHVAVDPTEFFTSSTVLPIPTHGHRVAA